MALRTIRNDKRLGKRQRFIGGDQFMLIWSPIRCVNDTAQSEPASLVLRAGQQKNLFGTDESKPVPISPSRETSVFPNENGSSPVS
jgi:hypothetical protein